MAGTIVSTATVGVTGPASEWMPWFTRTQAQRPAATPSGAGDHGQDREAGRLPGHGGPDLPADEPEGLEHGQIAPPMTDRGHQGVADRADAERASSPASTYGRLPTRARFSTSSLSRGRRTIRPKSRRRPEGGLGVGALGVLDQEHVQRGVRDQPAQVVEGQQCPGAQPQVVAEPRLQ